jgi:hypothetical protein
LTVAAALLNFAALRLLRRRPAADQGSVATP